MTNPTNVVKQQLFSALPWLTMIVNSLTINHAIHTQTMVTEIAAQGPAFVPQSQWLWLIIPAICSSGLTVSYFSTVKARSAAALALTMVMTALAFAGPLFLLPVLFIPVFLLGQNLYAAVSGNTCNQNIVAASLLTLILACAAFYRMESLLQHINTPPDPDMDSYLSIAAKATGWETFFREPFYVWVLQLIDFLGGTLSPIMARLTSIFASIVAVASIFELCRRHLNILVAIIAATMFSTVSFMVFNSVRGLRDDLVVATTFLFLTVAWNHLRSPATWKSLTVLGITAAACALTRFSSFSFTLVVIIAISFFRFWRDIKPWSLRARWILPVLICVGLMTPYLLHCKKTYGQAFFLGNYAARFYANEEFAGKHPDFPTLQEVAKDGYAGGVITPREYIFKYHTMSEVITRSWAGLIKTFFGLNFRVSFGQLLPPGIVSLLYFLHFIGIVFLLFPRRLFLPLAIFVFHAPLFFLAASRTFDPRLLNVASAFIYISIAVSIGVGLEYLWKYLKPSTDGASSAKYVSAKNSQRRKKTNVK